MSVPLEATLAPEFVRKEAGNSSSDVQYQLAENLWSQQQQRATGASARVALATLQLEPRRTNRTSVKSVYATQRQARSRSGSVRFGSGRIDVVCLTY